MDFLHKLKERLDLSESLIQQLSEYGVFAPGDLTKVPSDSYEDSMEHARDCVNQWFRVTQAIIAEERSENDINYKEFKSRGEKPCWGWEDLPNALIRKIRSGQRILNTLIEIETVKQQTIADKKEIKEVPEAKKTPKVFISHKQEDKSFADALVTLINFIIGPSGDKVFCSSIPGYGIRQSRDIIDDLKAQFDEHNIFMVIIHSPRYYKSTICLNEMGASWILGTKFSSFMTKDCTYDLLKGVIGKEKICINVNEERGTLNAHLNDFKNDLLSFFGLGAIDENKWEHARDRFVKEVSLLSYDSTGKDSSSEPSHNESVTRFTDEENAIIKKWVDSDSIEGHVVRSKDGTSFILGQDSYDAQGARNLMKWNDFIERLEKAKLIEIVRTNRSGNPVFQLTRIAFDYIDSLF